MIELDRHIEILLLSNDCVIVPGFGGFMAHYVGARYDEADGMWLPPYRTLGFNPQLTMNDSLLVQSYIEAYDISYPDALKRISSEVAEVRSHIDKDGSYSMNDLGTIFVNDEGHWEFRPCEAGILTPELYGLGSIEATPQDAVSTADQQHPALRRESKVQPDSQPQPAVIPTQEPATTTKENKHPRTISMTLLRNVAAACIAALAFLLIPTPLKNDATLQQGHLSSAILKEVIPHDEGSITLSQPLKVKATDAQENSTANDETSSASEQSKADKAKTTETKPFCIVLASRIKKSNAKAYVADLRQRGYNDARIIGKRHCKVVVGAYASEEEALTMQRRMRRLPEFQNCWSMKASSTD